MEIAESRWFRAYAQWITTHRFVVVLAILGITVFLATRLGKLEVDSNPNLWAPQNHAYVETTNLLEEIFGGRNITVIGIVPKKGDIYQPRVLEKIKRIQEQLELLPHAVRHNILSLAARKVKHVKGGADGMEVRPMMETVPQTPEEIERLRAAVASMPIYINALVSPDGKAAAVIADFKQDERSPNFIALNEGLRKIVERERDDSIDIYLGGLPIIGEAADRQFMKMPMFFGAALVIVMLVQYLVVPQLPGHAAADADRHPERDLEPRPDGPARRPSRSAQHHDADSGAGGRGRPRDPDPEALLRGVQPPARPRARRRVRANRDAVIESMVRVGPVMIVAGADRRHHLPVAGGHGHPDGAALRRLRRLRRARDDGASR